MRIFTVLRTVLAIQAMLVVATMLLPKIAAHETRNNSSSSFTVTNHITALSSRWPVDITSAYDTHAKNGSLFNLTTKHHLHRRARDPRIPGFEFFNFPTLAAEYAAATAVIDTFRLMQGSLIHFQKPTARSRASFLRYFQQGQEAFVRQIFESLLNVFAPINPQGNCGPMPFVYPLPIHYNIIVGDPMDARHCLTGFSLAYFSSSADGTPGKESITICPPALSAPSLAAIDCNKCTGYLTEDCFGVSATVLHELMHFQPFVEWTFNTPGLNIGDLPFYYPGASTRDLPPDWARGSWGAWAAMTCNRATGQGTLNAEGYASFAMEMFLQTHCPGIQLDDPPSPAFVVNPLLPTPAFPI